jgi:hypothetical protein
MVLALMLAALTAPSSAAAFDVCNRTDDAVTVAYQPNASNVVAYQVVIPPRGQVRIEQRSELGVLRVVAAPGVAPASPDVAVVNALVSYNVMRSPRPEGFPYTIAAGVCEVESARP